MNLGVRWQLDCIRSERSSIGDVDVVSWQRQMQKWARLQVTVQLSHQEMMISSRISHLTKSVSLLPAVFCSTNHDL